MQESDSDIINEVRRGNTRRFACLVHRHKDRAMTLAVRLLENREEAEEAVQDGFVRAYRSLDRFRGDSSFHTWFYRILYNLCMTRVTRRSQAKSVPLDDDGSMESSTWDSPPTDMLDQLAEAELTDVVSRELEALPEMYRAALSLFYVQEMSYEEIGEVLGIPLGTVKTNLFRGRALLKNRVVAAVKEEESIS